MTKLFSFKNVTKLYKNKFNNAEFRALDNISFTYNEQDTVAIIGESGAGKSTLAKLCLKYEVPDKGVVEYYGQDISKMTKFQLMQLRAETSFLFQDPYSSFNPYKLMEKSLEEPLLINMKLSKIERKKQIVEQLRDLQLSESDIFGKKPSQLSGGELQRVAIIRATLTNPKTLILDEPFASIDDENKELVLSFLNKLKSQRLNLLIITHDLDIILKIADYVIVMEKGKIVEQCSSKQILLSKDSYTKKLLKSQKNSLEKFEIE